MTRWTFQATGDETEVFDLADDDATPLVLVPFLDSETVEEHQKRVRLVTLAPLRPEAEVLLRDCLNALNRMPNGCDHPDTYRLASAIDAYFKEVANG